MEDYNITQIITDEVPQDELWEKIYKVEEILKDKYFPGDEYTLYKVLSTKTNNIAYRGISIKAKDIKTVPSFYICEDDFYLHNEEQVAKRVYESYNEQKEYQSKLNSFDLTKLYNYQNIKNIVYPMFLNKELNSDLDLAFYNVENLDDVVIAFYINVQDIDNNIKSLIKINNALFKMWNIPIQELLDQSVINLNKKGYYNKNIARYLIDRSEIFGHKLSYKTYLMAKVMEDEDILDVITTDRNLDFMYGSSFVYAARKKLADKYDGEFYFILSSIHESIIIRKHLYENVLSGEDIHKMVITVNRDILAKNDFLSDSVYKYIGSEDRFIKIS